MLGPQALRTQQNLLHPAAHTHVHLSPLGLVAMERVLLFIFVGDAMCHLEPPWWISSPRLHCPFLSSKPLWGPWSFPGLSLLNPRALGYSLPLRLDHSHHRFPHPPWDFSRCSNPVLSLDSRAEPLQLNNNKKVDNGALDRPTFPLSQNWPAGPHRALPKAPSHHRSTGCWFFLLPFW